MFQSLAKTGHVMILSGGRQPKHRMIISALPDKYQRRFDHLDKIDRRKAYKEKVETIRAVLPNAVEYIKDNEELVDEFIYIEAVSNLRLSPDLRIIIRKRVKKFIEDSNMPEFVIHDFIDFLENRGAY